MKIESPFHEGELAVQQRAGEQQIAMRNGSVIQNSILKGALKFIDQQTLCIIASSDAQGSVWTSLVFGTPGFMSAGKEKILISLDQLAYSSNDPLWGNIRENSRVGILVIDHATRRRLRVNGNLNYIDNTLRLSVEESYPNCPKFIQRWRLASLEPGGTESSRTSTGTSFTAAQREFIRSSHTFYVGSSHHQRGLDASHRGGNPGFVQMIDDRTLRIPDYQGNSMFNTLGNLTVNPKAGLVFFSPEDARVFQITGRADILWDHDDADQPSGGTKRYWDFTIDCWLEHQLPVKLTHDFLDYSPHNP